MAKIDIDRCRRAMKNLDIYGFPDTIERRLLIEETIRRIQESEKNLLKNTYLGIKRYAGFGDQREEYSYGFGPVHGVLVFSIKRTHQGKSTIFGKDEIYLLECTRDFQPGSDKLNLLECICQLDVLTTVLQSINQHISSQNIHIHTPQE